MADDDPVEIYPGQTCPHCGVELTVPNAATVSERAVSGNGVMVYGECHNCGNPIELLAKQGE